MSTTITIPTKDDSTSGYFRIGNVVLSIPPESIEIHRTSNVDELNVLRAKFPYLMETGQSRWDVGISWVAMYDTNPHYNDPWHQWEDVRTIIAMIKSAPFVEVENDLIRSTIASNNAELDFSQDQPNGDKGYFRLAFALRQLKITTTEDIVDGVRCQLLMTLFNYLPHTTDFSYVDSKGMAVDADKSDLFSNYLESWKYQNLDTPTDGPTSPWRDQDDTSTTFMWRTYMAQPGRPADAPKDLDTTLWVVDHFNDHTTLRCKDNNFILDNSNNDYDLYTTNFSVIFSSQFAQLPLASYQYPCYQHIGPNTTMVGIAMEADDPDGEGIGLMSAMLNELKKQHLQFRHEWSSVASVYRRTAILIRNKFLNMLGIWGISPTDFTVSTIPNAANKLTCSLLARQYENYYEVLAPFKVYGNAHYLNGLFDYIKSDNLIKGLTDRDQSSIKKILDFKSAWKTDDDDFLASFLLSTDTQTTKTVQTLPNIPLPTSVTITQQNQDNLFNVLSKETPNDISSVVHFRPKGKDCWPWLWARHTNGHVLSYTEYWMLSRINNRSTVLGDPIRHMVVNSIKETVDPQIPFALRDQLWQAAFQFLAVSDATAKTQIESIVNSKGYKDSLGVTRSQALYGPGNDISNKDHGCYRDLGLTDTNPDSYFYDYSQEVSVKMAKQMEKTLTTSLQSFTAFNTQKGNVQTPPSKSQPKTVGSTTNVPVSLSDFGIESGNPVGIMMRSVIPRFSMKSCFPTYKLFLLEDDNTGIFYCYDAFHSYSSVTEIELIKYRDKPDTAIIQITNLAGLLSHRLYDNTAEGRREWDLSNDQRMNMSYDQPATGPEDSAIRVTRTPGGNYTTGKGSVDDPETPFTNDLPTVPLKYYQLQTGSKIQIRLGFDTNPDNLHPVFVGQVTQMDEQDGMITLVAQSYQTELNTIIADEVNGNGFSVTGLVGEALRKFGNAALELVSLHPINSIMSLFSALKFWHSPAYGGWTLFSGKGDASSVIKAMLKTSQSRHFGHWQINQLGDPYIKGFSWSDLAGAIIPGQLGTALKNSYDRSGENIMVNTLVNYDGSQESGHYPITRSWTFEATACIPAAYYINDPLKNPPWFYITDVARRYPEYILGVKPYGFPYQADATLIFAHPNDFYYSRGLLLGELGAMKTIPATAKAPFYDWWTNMNGRSRTAKMLQEYISDDLSTEVLQKVDQSLDANVYNQELDHANDIIEYHNPRMLSAIIPGAGSASSARAIAAVNGLRKEMNFYVNAKVTGKLGKVEEANRIQPVRRWHYVDQDTIIHNGIKLNDKFFNAIKLADDTKCINMMIPSHHQRVLNADELVESPDDNLKGAANKPVRTAVIQSFLREECGKMYHGELLIRGTPEIEPWDIVSIVDPSTGITGPVEVDSVIHTFNQEMGFVTIIKPRALVIVNEAASMSLLNSYQWAVTDSLAAVKGGGTKYLGDNAKVPGYILEAGTVAATATAIFGAPITAVVLGLAAAAAFGVAINLSTDMNVSMIFPLMRYRKPWIGGLQGYRAGDLLMWAQDKWNQFYTDEIAPVIDSWGTLTQSISPSLQTPQSVLVPTLTTPGGIAPSGFKPQVSALDAFAAAIQKFEGGHPKDRNMRNNNPGNLVGIGNGSPPRDGKFARYNTYQEGLDALKRDLTGKMTGHNRHGLGPNSTIQDLFNIYAPPEDNNPTVKYAQTVAKALGVTPETKLGSLLTA